MSRWRRAETIVLITPEAAHFSIITPIMVRWFSLLYLLSMLMVDAIFTAHLIVLL